MVKTPIQEDIEVVGGFRIEEEKGLGAVLGITAEEDTRLPKPEYLQYAQLTMGRNLISKSDGTKFRGFNIRIRANPLIDRHFLGITFNEFYLFPEYVTEMEARVRYDSLK